MIIASKQQHSAVRRRASCVAVLECVAAAVDAGTLGVPQGEYTVIFGPGKQIDLLASPDRCCSEFLVDRRLKANVAAVKKATRTPQRLIEPTQRRAAVARDEAPGFEARE